MADNIRQQLYDRIKAASRDAIILEEMKRLGFWQKGGDVPTLPEQLILREADLHKTLRELLDLQRKYQNREQALKEMRRARLAASREKREENKRLRKQKREEKAARWKALQQKDIIYLGDNVSAGLHEKVSNAEKLQQQHLPTFDSLEALASAMHISVGELRFLSYHRVISKTTHYKRFYIPKKIGGQRLISTPMPKLKRAQRWILEHILVNITLHDAAHGFVPKRSIVSNAMPHVKADVVINIDLKDFFPSITYPRVKGIFRAMGYSEQIATVFALICTEPERDALELDGQTYYAASTERHLPQGAPSSPAITNIICRRLDARLQGIARKLGFTYTRYADDLTFSANGEAVQHTKTLLGFIKKIIRTEKLTVHPDKFRVLRKGARHEVTGVVVNDKPAVNARELDRFRALLFQIEKDGPAGKHWNNSPNLLAAIKGYAAYIQMVDPAKGKPITERVQAILTRYQYKHVIRHKPKPPASPQTAPSADASQHTQPRKPWWKFW